MNIDIKYLAVGGLVCAVLGAALTRQFAPREVTKTQTVTVTQTQVVEKEAEKDHTVTTTKQLEFKNGIKETITTTTQDRSQIEDKKTDSMTEQKTTTVVTKSVEHQWFASIGVGVDAHDIAGSIANPEYQISVDRRILGPAYIGIWGNTKSQFGVELGLEF